MFLIPFGLARSGGGGGGGGGGSFVPTDLGAALQRWYDASNTGSITIATGVSQWNDLSGNGAHLTQATSGNQPAYNSGVSVDFEAGSTRVLTASGWPSSTYDVYIVITTRTTNSTYRSVLHGGQQVIIFNAGNDDLGLWNGGFGGSGYSLATSTKGLIRLKVDSGKAASMNLNGNTMSGTITTYTGTDASVTNVGNDTTSGRQVGKIHEIVVTDNLGTTDQQKIEGYLAWKWGTNGSLPGGHPYFGAAP